MLINEFKFCNGLITCEHCIQILDKTDMLCYRCRLSEVAPKQDICNYCCNVEINTIINFSKGKSFKYGRSRKTHKRTAATT